MRYQATMFRFSIWSLMAILAICGSLALTGCSTASGITDHLTPISVVEKFHADFTALAAVPNASPVGAQCAQDGLAATNAILALKAPNGDGVQGGIFTAIERARTEVPIGELKQRAINSCTPMLFSRGATAAAIAAFIEFMRAFHE